MRAHILKQNPLFASLPLKEAEHLISTLHRIQLPQRSILFHEGEPGECFYIVLEGRLDVIKALGTPEERLLRELGPGDTFGEMSLLQPRRVRTASVRSRTPSTLLEMGREAFESLLRQRPSMVYELARRLSERLRDSDSATIRDLQEKNRQLSEAYLELQAAQEKIIEKEKLEHELQVARKIQMSILPRSLPHLSEFEFGARVVPARAVGGDFFDFIVLGPDRVGIAIGDVSDKGVPAAIFMAMTRSLVRAEAKRSQSPREVLEEVNRHLLGMNDAGMFVTMLYGVLDREKRAFSYARAGQTLPLFCGPQGSVAVPSCRQGQPLGILPNPAIDEQTLTLPPGSTFLIYTDGITEAMNDRWECFGSGRLHDALRCHWRISPCALCDSLIEAVTEHQQAALPHDDIALVVVHATE
jgi:serine phosphatase RsbU (regulator of sigma subunit)